MQGHTLSAHSEAINEVEAVQEGQKVETAALKARTTDVEEDVAELRAQVATLQAQLVKVELGTTNERENQSPHDVD